MRAKIRIRSALDLLSIQAKMVGDALLRLLIEVQHLSFNQLEAGPGKYFNSVVPKFIKTIFLVDLLGMGQIVSQDTIVS